MFAALAARPLIGEVRCVTGIVNDRSNHLLTRLADTGSSFASALDEAQRVGYAEPDPSRDVDGLDAADKLTLLASLFGWGTLSRDRLEVNGIRALTADHLAAARELGGAIKPIVRAARGASGIEAFVGPAFLSSREPLATLDGALNGIRLDGKYVSNLFFSGPGAGPDVTAATLLDDAIEACQSAKGLPAIARETQPATAGAKGAEGAQRVRAPVTSWFVRVIFPGVVPDDTAVERAVAAAGLQVERVVLVPTSNARWLLLGPHSREEIATAEHRLAVTHRIKTHSIRCLTGATPSERTS